MITLLETLSKVLMGIGNFCFSQQGRIADWLFKLRMQRLRK